MSSELLSNQSYALATGQTGAKRLNVQNEILAPFSHELLAKAGLHEGMTVYDIACGSGVMTEYLAKQVGPSGKVIAADISEEQLAVAKERIAAENLTNVTFVHDDILNTKLPKNQADLIYVRFVLMHLTAPLDAISNLKSLLKPNGVIASEEAIKSTTTSSYQTALFKTYIDSLVALGKHLGVDYDLGEKLGTLYEQSGFSHVQSYRKSLPINAQYAQLMFSYSVKELGQKMLTAGIATQENIDTWLQVFKDIPLHDPAVSFKLSDQAYVIATR